MVISFRGRSRKEGREEREEKEERREGGTQPLRAILEFPSWVLLSLVPLKMM